MDERGLPAESAVDELAYEQELERLKCELNLATERAENVDDLLRQVRADFAAYKRQVHDERSELLNQARLDVLVQALPIFDHVQQLIAAGDDLRGSPEWYARLTQVGAQVEELLKAEGVEKIHAVGALFNPWEHEAVQHQASPELEDQRVLAVLRDGYRIGDRVICPAQVVVARQSR